MITIRQLTKIYKGKTVVDHLNLAIKEGEAFALLGNNGAGKLSLKRIKVLDIHRKPYTFPPF